MGSWRALATLLLGILLAPKVFAAEGGGGPKSLPRDAQCGPLPLVKVPRFLPGEELDYDLDVLIANAARMEVVALPKANGTLPIRVRVTTNTFFNKVRKVKAEAQSILSQKSLHPLRYTEDAWEDGERRTADVSFRRDQVLITYATNPQRGGKPISVGGRFAHDALDVAGAIYLVRSLDLKPGLAICFDAYAMRHMWRVWGTVEGIEKASTKAGDFDAFVISGTAARLDAPSIQRDLQIWISSDEKRIPLGALGSIDLGPVRATLVHVGRNDDRQPKQSRINSLDW